MTLRKNQVTKEILINFLAEGICKISFAKKDGSTKTSFCTLNHDLIPTKYFESVAKVFLPDSNPDIIPFWDVAEGAWKSFYLNNIQYFITAKELREDSSNNAIPHQSITSENKDAEDIQDIDDNQQEVIDKQKSKQAQSLEDGKNTTKIDPINKTNIRKSGYSRKTKSNITERYERQKKSRENAQQIINRLRKEAEERRKRR